MLFDNLGVMDITGPVLEETHYYPFGLTMAGISTVAPLKIANKFRYQGKELQNKEFADNSGLKWYDFEARYYGPQIGRWWSQDPANQYASPYLAMGNNWVVVVDPDGHFVVVAAIIAAAVVNGIINVASQALKGNVHNLGQGLEYFAVGAVAGAAYVIPGGGPLLAGGIQAGGNKLVQYVNGQWDPSDIHNGWDAAGLALDLGIDFISPGIGANLGTSIAEQAGWITSANFSGSFVKVGANLSSGLTFSGTAEVTATKLGSRVAQVAELEAANTAKGFVEGGTKLYREAMFKAFERQLQRDGIKSILKSQAKIQRKLTEHLLKLAEIQKTGGFSSSVEREIRTFKAQLEAINDLLK